MPHIQRNVFGEQLEVCSLSPRTGFYRTGCCDTGAEDIVRLNVYSTDPDGLKYLMAHREQYLNPRHTPASTWVVVSRLANPKWVVEMETVAAKA